MRRGPRGKVGAPKNVGAPAVAFDPLGSAPPPERPAFLNKSDLKRKIAKTEEQLRKLREAEKMLDRL